MKNLTSFYKTQDLAAAVRNPVMDAVNILISFAEFGNVGFIRLTLLCG
jgi:hypothetical protein